MPVLLMSLPRSSPYSIRLLTPLLVVPAYASNKTVLIRVIEWHCGAKL